MEKTSQQSSVHESNSKNPAVFGISRIHRWGIAAVAALVLGIALSHKIAPNVRVEKIILAQNTPTLRICFKTPGPHPIALLAHGATASKETLFRLGEAFATAGFDCDLIDLPGHGESRQLFSVHDV